MNTATKTGIDAAKTASKVVVQKTAEATGNLIGSKIADKITSVGKPKSKEKKIKQKRFIFYQKRDNKSLINLRLFQTSYKNGIPKRCKFARYNI